MSKNQVIHPRVANGLSNDNKSSSPVRQESNDEAIDQLSSIGSNYVNPDY